LVLLFPLQAAGHFVSLIIAAAHNRRLCNTIESNLMGGLERLQIVSQVLSVPFAPFLIEMPGSAEGYIMDPARSCIWVLSWMQITFGFGLSLALVYIVEARVRNDFQRQRRAGIALPRPPYGLVFQGWFFYSIVLWGLLRFIEIQ
jgi:hypothetical protein